MYPGGHLPFTHHLASSEYGPWASAGPNQVATGLRWEEYQKWN